MQLVSKRRSKTAERRVKKRQAFAEVSIAGSKEQSSINEVYGSIKVTIKDKPNCDSKGQRILKSCFDILRENARDKRRLREIKVNIRDIVSRRRLRRCIHAWRMHVKNVKKNRREEHAKADTRDSDARKIETLVDTIAEAQKESNKCRRAGSKGLSSNGAKDVKKRIPAKPCEPLSRLNAQKEIIQKQKLKLAEQSQLIEELKLKQVQEEITRSGEQTVNAAKETLMRCGQQTRRTLIQLMRQAGYRLSLEK